MKNSQAKEITSHVPRICMFTNLFIMRSHARSFDRELWRQQSDRARGRSNFVVRSIIYFRCMSSILAQIGKHENNRTLPTVMLYCLMLTCFDVVGDTWQLRIGTLYGPPPSQSTRWWKARFTNFNEKTIMQPCTWRLSNLYYTCHNLSGGTLCTPSNVGQLWLTLQYRLPWWGQFRLPFQVTLLAMVQ